MLSRCWKYAFGWQLIGLMLVGCLTGTSGAWQFRDLDQPLAASAESDESSSDGQLLDLVPTEEVFGDPGGSDVAQKDGDTKDATKAPAPTPAPTKAEPTLAAKPKKPTPKTTQGIIRKVQPRTHSIAKKPAKPGVGDKIPKAPELEPIPMPDLGHAPILKTPPTSAESTVLAAKPGKPVEQFTGPSGPPGEYAAMNFRGVEPGQMTKEELIEAWGKPARFVKQDDETMTLVYRDKSFKQVEVTIEDDNVARLLVHLKRSMDVARLEKDMGIAELVPVPIPDEFGEVLGQAFPERGMMFSFVEDSDASRVRAIMIEPVSSEMFRLRAQYDFDHNYQFCIEDLETALEIDPLDSEAHWLLAEYLDSAGKCRTGLKSVQKAVRLKPTNAAYRLTRARLYAKTGRDTSAISEVKAVLKEIEMQPEVEAGAHKLLGDLQATGLRADHHAALKSHLKAIDLASQAVDDSRFAVRRKAKHVVVTAHMAVARDIAMGNFQRQSEVVPKWLLRSTELADEFIADDQGDQLLQMQIYRDTLAAYGELQKVSFEASVAAEEALRTAREMISEASDEYYKSQIERLLAESLLHAARIHRSRGKLDTAMTFANNGLALLENTREDWEETTHDQYLEALLQFTVGSVHAIRDDDHDDAVEWYSKARSSFVGSSFFTPLYAERSHGEMYVSMGLSYWEHGDQAKAIKVTRTGADLMKQAVEEGSLQLRAMAVPYGNLATMHGRLGEGKKSQDYAKLVAKLEELGTVKR